MTQERIIATDDNIIGVVYWEIDRLGNQADLNHVDVSRVTTMHNLFTNTDFNGDISQWNVSGVRDMTEMFVRSKFNGDISQWNTAKVEDMSSMFFNSEFNGDISRWNTSNVESMSSMFTRSKFNGNISQWDVSKVESMVYMFRNSAFRGDISQWAVRDDLAADFVFEKSPVSAHPSFGKLHFMAKADDESKSRNESPMRHFMVTAELLDKPPMLHPAAEKAYATFMPIARAMYPNESGAVQAARAWEAYQSSLSTSDSYDYTSALFAFDPSNN